MTRNELLHDLSPDADDLRTRAVIDTICLSLASDGYITEEEQEAAVAILTRDLEITAQEAQDLATRAFSRIQTNGLEASMASIAEAIVSPGDRRALLEAAAVVQYVDDTITPEEDDFLYQFADCLGIEHDEVDAIVDRVEADLD